MQYASEYQLLLWVNRVKALEDRLYKMDRDYAELQARLHRLEQSQQSDQ